MESTSTIFKTCCSPARTSDQRGEANASWATYFLLPSWEQRHFVTQGNWQPLLFSRKPENRKSWIALSGSIFVLHLTTTHTHCVGPPQIQTNFILVQLILISSYCRIWSQCSFFFINNIYDVYEMYIYSMFRDRQDCS